jgi:hypothetical protein
MPSQEKPTRAEQVIRIEDSLQKIGFHSNPQLIPCGVNLNVTSEGGCSQFAKKELIFVFKG